MGVCLNEDGIVNRGDDVDAIVIATPDHWHTKIAIEAMESGKDIYCEKPLSHTIEQALACRDAVHRTGRTLQVGPQGTSDGRIWAARDAIEAGRIGAARFVALVDSYGHDTVVAAFEDLMDYSEKLMRQAISDLPDGDYRAETKIDGYLDEVPDMPEPVATVEPPRCGCGGLIRPNVVWFGEPLPDDAWQRSVDAVVNADLVVVVGTSSVVYPAAGLPELGRE